MEQVAQVELFELPPAPKRLTKKEQEEALLEGLCDRVLARCQEEGIDPRQLAIHLHYRETALFLRQIKRNERHQFIARLMREFFGHE